MKRLGALGLLALLLVAAAPADDELDQLLRDALEGAPFVRPQAAQRLVRAGEPAAELVLAAAGEGNAGLARLGADLVAVLGEFEHAELRARLWSALDDRDFPWRPAAARGLASSARAGEGERFLELRTDALAAVRRHALDGLSSLGQTEHSAAVRASLEDPDDGVRRTAAVLLDEWGERDALWWLVEELERDDRYFDTNTGKAARYEALRALRARLGEVEGFDARSAPDTESNRVALAALAQRVEQIAGARPELPEVARSAAATSGDLLGLEVRSCRRGEYCLRWNADGALYVGRGNAARVPLAEGAVEELVRLARASTARLGGEDSFGQPGCDMELLRIVPAEGGRAEVWSVSKGPDAHPDLRPRALGELCAALLASVPTAGEDARLEGLREAVAEALRAVGGAVPDA